MMLQLSKQNSKELARYGINFGLANYPAAYCTGRLVAQRIKHIFKLTDVVANKAILQLNPKPFRVILDVGIARTSTGARCFAVMKGAIDGGLTIPHDLKRMPGGAEEKKFSKYIFGQHVADYMKKLAKENPERYNAQFSRFIKAGIKPEDLKKIYTEAHKKIDQDPSPKPKATSHYQLKVPQVKKLTFEQKRANLNKKLIAAGLPPKPEHKQ